jgi:quercetin dioxygenase-like cupin family protein
METEGRGASEDRVESIHPGNRTPVSIGTGVSLREFAGKGCGAVGFTTGTATFEGGAFLPYHRHSVSEAIVILQGHAHIVVEGRRYLLEPLDCIHVPAGIAHEVTNVSGNSVLMALSAFASAKVSRELLQGTFAIEQRGLGAPCENDPESIVRGAQAEKYQLSENAEFRDLFGARFGAVGICGGHGRFLPGASLPCHIHEYDESITIVGGEAVCLVQGKRYELSGYDTAFVPKGRPHRFLNESDSPMAMVWVYAGSDPERTLVSPSYCDGTLAWPERKENS